MQDEARSGIKLPWLNLAEQAGGFMPSVIIHGKFLVDNRCDIFIHGMQILEKRMGREYTAQDVRSFSTEMERRGVTTDSSKGGPYFGLNIRPLAKHNHKLKIAFIGGKFIIDYIPITKDS